MKFKAGDRIKTISSDRSGHNYAKIVQTEIINSEDHYLVAWDNIRGQHYYVAKDVDGDWELADMLPIGQCPVVTTHKLKYEPSVDQGYWNYGEPADKTCNHKWKEYNGYNDFYEYCEKCDEKRKT